jgi:hypothetical protein
VSQPIVKGMFVAVAVVMNYVHELCCDAMIVVVMNAQDHTFPLLFLTRLCFLLSVIYYILSIICNSLTSHLVTDPHEG